jgi:hypothetical protein
MTGQATDLENLKRNIKAAQAEHERLNLLISEFTGDKSVSRGPRSIKDRHEALWKLIAELRLAFSNSPQESHPLFSEATQLTDVGYQRMFTSYQIGIKRMVALVEQDIFHTATQVKAGRGKRDLIPLKVKEMKKRKREARLAETRVDESGSSSVQAPIGDIDTETHDMDIDNNKKDQQPASSSKIDLPSKPRTQRPRHKTTAVEEEILKELEAYEDSTVLPKEVTNTLVKKLSQHTDYWTSQRIRNRWRYKRLKKVCAIPFFFFSNFTGK